MSDLPPMPPTPPTEPTPKGKAPKSTSAGAPDLLFVENLRTSLVTLRYHDAEHPAPGLAASKFLGPGVNLIARSIVDACTRKDKDGKIVGEFAEGLNGALALVEPLKLRTHEAVALAGRTSSRQALHAWRKDEKCGEVLAAIAERLSPKAKKAAPTDDDEGDEIED